MFLGEVP